METLAPPGELGRTTSDTAAPSVEGMLSAGRVALLLLPPSHTHHLPLPLLQLCQLSTTETQNELITLSYCFYAVKHVCLRASNFRDLNRIVKLNTHEFSELPIIIS